MSLPEYSLKNRKVVWFFLFILLAGGALGFVTLGKKEDSVFVIKSASLVCSYPGATPLEVEQLVTEPIEREVQSMRLVHKITSESYYGLSKILVELDPATRASEIPQLWDELRRKVLNIQPRLPAGASPVTVADDFGDVYGIYYGLSVDGGFTWAELRDWAQRIKTALVTVDGVQKVSLFGEQTPVVNVYVNLAALANFAIRPETIVATIGQQNTIVNSGEKQAGALQIQILEAGTYKGLDDISNQMLTAASGKQYRLGDIARVERGYADPPQTLMRVDGRRAVGIGISTEAQVDVVKTGEKIIRVLDGLTRQMPVGMDLTVLYPENRIAQQANATFVLNLAESVAIVILIIMLVMGFRAGVLIGSSLLFSIGGTLLLMQFLGEGLNRTSLAGFIIAMGMLVDNAIVVTDNAQQAMLRGVARRRAVVDGANAPCWSLLGATLIAIFSFLPLYLAPSSVAEIVKPLFVVLALSLLLSWVLALTQTPLFGDFMLRVKPVAHDPYDTKFYRTFDRILTALLRWRWGVVAGVAALFAAALAVMGLMPQNFFPSLDKPYFRADVLLPEGYNIRDTERNLRTMEEWLHAQPEVKTVSVTMGSTPPRYYLASSSVSLRPNFGNILVELHDKGQTEVVEARFNAYVRAMCPDVWLRSSLFKLSPVPDAAIEFGFIGDDIDTLRRLTQAAEEIMWRTPGTVNIRNSWGNRVPTWLPLYSQMKGQRIGVTRSQMAQGITIATQGYRLGEYREGDQFMPILLKDENIDTYNLTNLQALPIFTPAGKVYSIEQATDGFRFEYRGGVVKRYNRQRVMKAQCDPGRGVNTMRLYAALRDSVLRGVVLPEGYSMKVFGEQESQQESNSALARYMPLTMVLIFIVLLLLFRNYREPVVILLMIPLIFIGVVLGGDGFGYHDPRYAAPVVRLDVRRHGRHDHGRPARRHAADGLRAAGRLCHFLQYPQVMKNYLILSALLAFVPAAAQTSLGDYRQAVTEYSWELKVAASKSDAASQTMGQARTGYLPRLSLDGSFTATVHHYDGVERWNFSVLPQLVQTVYGGGAVRAAYKQAELGYDIALCDEEFTQLDVRYAAEYTYWNLSAMELYAASMRQYVNIIRSLKEVVDRRFAEGYIAKGDVLMIDARLSEAQYGLVSAEQNYTVALHNFNILRGTDPDLAVELAQGIRDSLPQPVRVLPDEVLGRRPDYMAARLRSEQADAGIRAARAPFNPQVSVGIGGSWQPYFPNRTGATTVDGSAFVKLTLPIFHWGERRRATGAARAVQRQSEWNTALLHDNIVRDEMNGWTALVNSRAQVDATEQSLRIAGENLDISTYSYGEGLSTILDVLQAQLSWIQLYTNAIKAHYNYAVAVSDYLRITAQ